MDRKYLKQQAKAILKMHYSKLFVLGIIVSLLCFEFIDFTSNTTYSGDYTYTTYHLNIFTFDFVLEPSVLLVAIVSIAAVARLIYGIFFGDVIKYGYSNKLKYYALGRENEFDLFEGFRNNYKNVVMVNLMAGLKILFYSLLLIIPGVIKAFEYYFINQITEEHPEWGWREVLKESKRLTDGHKWQLFVLELSFFLWRLLVGFIPIIGSYLLEPYTNMTYAYAYLYLKELNEDKFEPEMIMNENMF